MNQIQRLEPGIPYEGELQPGQKLSFPISLETGNFIRVVVEQLGVDVSVSINDPMGKQLVKMDSPFGTRGPESVSLLAEAPGEFTIIVEAPSDALASGRYTIKVEGPRLPQDGDLSRLKAEQAYLEARRLKSGASKESWQQAAVKYQEALLLWQQIKDRAEQIKTLFSLGELHRALEKWDDSAGFFQRTIELGKQAGDIRAQAYSYSRLGLIYLYSDTTKSLEFSKQALPLWEQQGDRLNEAVTANNSGLAADYLGDPDTALSYYQQATRLREGTGERQGAASTCNNLGLLYDKLGNPQQAITYYTQALALLRSLPNPDVFMRRKISVSLTNLGIAHTSLGDMEKALEYYDEAISIARAAHGSYEEVSALIYVGNSHLMAGNLNEALADYTQALSLAQEAHLPDSAAYCQMYTGEVYAAQGEHQKALSQYLPALETFRKTLDHVGEVTVLDKIAAVYAALGETQTAREHYNRALTLWRAVRDPRGEAATLYGLARFERSQGNYAEAHSRAAEALKIVENLRSRVVSQSLRTSYLSSIRDYYDFDIDALMQLHKRQPSAGYEAMALQISEQGRARSLLDSLAEVGREIRQGVKAPLLELEQSLLRQMEAKSQRQIELLSANKPAEQVKVVEKELDSLVARYKDLQAEIRAQSPRYAALTQPQPLTLKEIQQQVLDPDTLLLEYVLGEERSYLWLVSQSQVQSVELPKRSVIEAAARKVYKLVSTSESAFKEQNQQYWESAADLSRMILAPVAGSLQNKRLLIVSEGALQYVPFSALPITGNPPEKTAAASLQNPAIALRPLLVEHEILQLPSASVIAVLRQELKARKPPGRLVAVLADPVYSKEDKRVRSPAAPVIASAKAPSDFERVRRDFSVANGHWDLSPLAASRREAETIRGLAPAGAAKIALDFQASRATAVDESLGHYRIIHFATHALLDGKNPDLSCVVLSLVDEKGATQDGFLRLNDIYNLKLSADLVVLSACETALGSDIRGEGLIGLTRGFMYAGAARVVASLWKVQDDQTAELMGRFYEKLLKEGMQPAAALRVAQLEMWRRNRKNAPYYWAAFVLQGEWKEPVERRTATDERR